MSQTERTQWSKREDQEGDDEIASLSSSRSSDSAQQRPAQGVPSDSPDTNANEKDQTFEAQIPEQGPSGPAPPPNGGYGWVCTACVGLINAHTWGLNSSYGVFLAHYLATNAFPGATPLEFAFVGSLSISCAMLVSPLATVSCREMGVKPTLAIGIVLETASFIAASFASKIWHLFLSQGICFGFGMGFLFVASVGIVPQWFTTRRSLANGFATAGSGLGGLVYSLAAGAMIRNIGLPWAFRILGIICFVVNTVSTILLRDRNKIIGSNQLAFDADLFRRIEYNLLLLYGFFSMLGYVVLIFSLANYANEIGLDASQASIVSAIFNLGQGLGRPLIGYFSDHVGRINMAAGMTLLCGVFSFAIWVPASSYGVLLFFAVVGGMVAGTFWCTIAPVMAEVVGLKDVPSGLNIIWLDLVLPCTFSEPIALEIVQGTGEYLGAQLFVAFMYVAAAACLFVLRGWKIGETDEIALATALRPEEIDPIKSGNSDAVSIKSRKAGRRKMLAECWKWRKV